MFELKNPCLTDDKHLGCYSQDGFSVAEVENENVALWQERHVGSLLGVPRRDGPMYGGVGGRPGCRDRVIHRARHQWLLVERPDHGERQLDSAD
jgi:hypothetical protein